MAPKRRARGPFRWTEHKKAEMRRKAGPTMVRVVFLRKRLLRARAGLRRYRSEENDTTLAWEMLRPMVAEVREKVEVALGGLLFCSSQLNSGRSAVELPEALRIVVASRGAQYLPLARRGFEHSLTWLSKMEKRHMRAESFAASAHLWSSWALQRIYKLEWALDYERQYRWGRLLSGSLERTSQLLFRLHARARQARAPS